MFNATAFQRGVPSKRPAQHLFKCVCNLETILGKQAHSKEGYYLQAKAEEREEQGGRSETPVATVAGGWLMRFDLQRKAVWLNLLHSS